LVSFLVGKGEQGFPLEEKTYYISGKLVAGWEPVTFIQTSFEYCSLGEGGQLFLLHGGIEGI
jgi:hypothetical protein